MLPDYDIDALVGLARDAGGHAGMKTMPDGSQAPYELNVNYFDALAAGHDDRGSLRHRLHDNLAALLRRRAAHPAFAPSAPQRVVKTDPGLFVVERGHPGASVLCLHEIAGHRQEYAGQVLEPYEARWIPAVT